MSDKTPQPGEWMQLLQGEKTRAFIVGKIPTGKWLLQIDDGEFITDVGSLDKWERLPDCTGFDWQPETFPQYWTSRGESETPVAYLRRSFKDTFYHVYADGTEHGPYLWITEEAKERAQITKEEAESRIEKPQPAESPDDWVVQDRVPAREGIDSFRWSSWHSGQYEIVESRHIACGNLHGWSDPLDAAVLELRCRRKDLPLHPKFATLANEIEQLRADMMRRCDELGVRLTELEEGGK